MILGFVAHRSRDYKEKEKEKETKPNEEHSKSLKFHALYTTAKDRAFQLEFVCATSSLLMITSPCEGKAALSCPTAAVAHLKAQLLFC